MGPSYRSLPDRSQHSQQTFTVPKGSELAIPAREQQETHALDRAANGIVSLMKYQPFRKDSGKQSLVTYSVIRCCVAECYALLQTSYRTVRLYKMGNFVVTEHFFITTLRLSSAPDNALAL